MFPLICGHMYMLGKKPIVKDKIYGRKLLALCRSGIIVISKLFVLDQTCIGINKGKFVR